MFTKKIVALAGGPRSGKSSTHRRLASRVLEKPGRAVVFLPEVASVFFSQRGKGLMEQDIPLLRQHYIHCTELLLEEIAEDSARTSGISELILITDRGILDSAAYLRSAEELYEATGSEKIDTGHYDFVLYFLGQAKSGGDGTRRVERDEEESRAVSEATLRAWSSAPRIVRLEQYATIEEKVDEAARLINEAMGEEIFR